MTDLGEEKEKKWAADGCQRSDEETDEIEVNVGPNTALKIDIF